MVLYLGPDTASENLSKFRQFTSGAALVFSPGLMKQGIKELLGWKVYMGCLVPALAYGFVLALPRRGEGQRWGVLFVLATVNLVWYVVASIGWLRYAFPGLAIVSLFVARFFGDLTDGFRFRLEVLREALRQGQPQCALRWVALAWLIAMVVLPLGQTAYEIVTPAFNAPVAMAAYLDRHVSREVLIETWEPELGFLTDHNYHFPPALLLNSAVGYMWYDGPSPAQEYDFVQREGPDYVLVGEFARWVNLYPIDVLKARYRLVTRIGAYELYALGE
jgi:hypothetical protein